MINAAVVTLAVSLSAAAPAEVEPSEKTKIIVLDLETSGVDASQAELLNGVVAQTLAPFDHLEVVTTGDIRRVADFEAQKQALGCDQDSCLAEIAGAMGARYVIFGRIGQLEELILVQLNLFDAEEARPVAREELRGKRLDELVDRMGPATTRLARSLLPADAVIEEDPVSTSTTSDGPGALTLGLRWGGAGVAGLGLVVATVASAVAAVEYGIVSDGSQDAKARNDGKVIGAAMVVTAGVGAALAAVGLGAFGVSFVDLE